MRTALRPAPSAAAGPTQMERPAQLVSKISVDASIAKAFGGSGVNTNPNCNNNTNNGNYVVLGEVQYPFQPTGLYFSVSTMTLRDSIIMIPRVASPITVQQ